MLNDTKTKRRKIIICSILLVSMALFFIAGALNQITVEKCKKLNLPILYITTNVNKPITKKDKYVDAYYELGIYSGKCKVRGHGNTTWVTRELSKKPYLLKLENPVPLCGLESGQKWILMANTSDKSVLRNYYAENLATNVWNNFKWTPHSKFITVILNGKYNGIYGLTEKIEMESGRLLEVCGKDSFLVCSNSRMDKEYNFISEKGFKFSIRSPKADDATYIEWRKIFQSYEDKIYSNLDWTKDELGKYFDLDSFVDWFLINDFSKNHDARFQASCFMYYDSAIQKIFMGPVWDFDLAFGNISWDNCEKTTDFWVNTNGWYEELWKRNEFKKAVKNRWNEKKQEIAKSTEWLTEQAELLKVPIDFNNRVFPTFGKRRWPHTKGWIKRKNHKAEMEYLTNWINERYEWYDTALNAPSTESN